MAKKVRVAIVGAGLGGIAVAVTLERAGLDSFTIFEKAPGPGGVWFHNSYPGCEVDVPSRAYSFSFMPYDWSGTFAKQSELRRYAEDVIERFSITSHIRYGTAVHSAVWNPWTSTYTLTTADDETYEAEVCVSAIGLLSNPKIPDWPGLDAFTGSAFHTAEFDSGVSLEGKSVALVGTGSSACQIGPAIAADVAQLYNYQREPGHVLPKRGVTYDDATRAKYARFPVLQRVERVIELYRGVKAVRATDPARPEHKKVERYFDKQLEQKVTDPTTRTALRPKYPYGCKRPIFANGYYEMFNRPNVDLVPHAVTRVTPTGLVDATGTERQVDVVIIATGFHVAVTSRLGLHSGRSLPEVCRERFPVGLNVVLWVQAELVAVTTDLAEIVGAAIGLNLVFGIALLPAGLITAVVAFSILALQHRGCRHLELTIIGLLAVIAAGFVIIWLKVGGLSFSGVAHGLVPRLSDDHTVSLAVAIVGATVMPHVIYLHSALQANRIRPADDAEWTVLSRYNCVDCCVGLGLGGLVNIAMICIAAVLFHHPGLTGISDLEPIHHYLGEMVGRGAALAFGIALIASGLSSSTVGTYAGQVVMAGFMNWRIPLLVRRTMTIVPSLIVLALASDMTTVLVYSQVVLAFGIPFALVPLALLTSRRDVIGPPHQQGADDLPRLGHRRADHCAEPRTAPPKLHPIDLAANGGTSTGGPPCLLPELISCGAK